MIHQIADILTAAETAQFCERLMSARWTDGAASAGQLAARAKHNHQLGDDDPIGSELAQVILERLARNPHFMATALPLKVLPPRFNRYSGDGAYGDHIDSAIFPVPATGQRLRSDLSATLFLSDPDSYDGGELVIGRTGQSIKLPAGHMVLYPSDSLHQVRPVTRGTRYASFFWVQSLVREQSRRALLLDLDEAIQALSLDVPDSPEIMRLTGVYHNLLREWADT